MDELKTIKEDLRTRDLALNQAVGARERHINLGIFAGVLDTLVPAEVCCKELAITPERLSGYGELTNLEVVLIRQREGDLVNLRSRLKDLLAHPIHGGLNRSTVVGGKDLKNNVAGSFIGLVESLYTLLNLSEVVELLPGPGAVNIGRHNAVPDLGKSGELVTDEAVESRAGALEHGQIPNTAANGDALAGNIGRDVTALLAVAPEAVWVRLAIDDQAGPTVHLDVDMGHREVSVLVQEVLAELGGKEFRRVDRELLSLDVNGVLDRIGSNDDRVVGLSVTAASSVSENVATLGNFGLAYEVSMSPSTRAQTVISVTVWTPVFSSRWTL